jgi:lycopene beta-cyclase
MLESKFSADWRRQGYDFIFLGAGCATLSIVMRMIKSGKFAEKKILLIDKEQKTKNDRTWCYWETQPGFFEDIVYCKWDTVSFLSEDFSATTNISPYQYKMIRGIDFYNYCFDEIKKNPNIEILNGILRVGSFHKEGLTIKVDDKTLHFSSATIFNSTAGLENKQPGGEIKLLQHFKGWIVESAKPVFDPRIASIMDFRVPQDQGTTFAYVLPFSETKALVEYTLFTKTLLEQQQYDAGLKNYLTEILKLESYTVSDTEFGVIPMTNRKFEFQNNGVFNIGTAGGQTKASSGYTFQFIQRQSQIIVDSLIKGSSLKKIPSTPKRFRFYDNTLLQILYQRKLPGKDIFSRMFARNDAVQVLKFLDNESTFIEELKIISTLPTFPFLKAALKQF